MDYIFLSTIFGISALNILLTYDVVCQWKKRFWTHRLDGLPERLRPLIPPSAIQFGAPKFHLPAHERACQAPHSLNYKPGAGETDGESVERNWADINGAAASTREMGPGSRHDTLDDYCGFTNWRKLCGLGKYFFS